MEYNSSEAGLNLLLHFSGNLTGNFDSASIIASANKHLENGGQNLILDLSKLDNLNSTGLNLFINLLNAYKTYGNTVFISGANERIKGVITVTKLNTVFVLTEDITKALEYKLPETNSNR